MGFELQVFDGATARQRRAEEQLAEHQRALTAMIAELDAEAAKSMVSDVSRHARWWRHRVRELFGR
jgi:hypothetical protein